MIIDPDNPATLYAASIGGGVFQSTDGGAGWNPVTTGLTSKHAWALAMDPQSSSTLYAGTQGAGIYKSTDGGANWIAFKNNIVNTTLSTIVVDPADPSTVYAAGNCQSLYRSTWGSGWWYPVYGVGSCVNVLAVDRQTLYAGTNLGVAMSTNGGGSWSTGAPGTTIESLAINPRMPATAYAGTRGGGVFRLRPTLFVDFGPDKGLFSYNGVTWNLLSVWDPINTADWSGGLAVDFGAGKGLFNYDGSSWQYLTGWAPENLLPWGSSLVVDFGAGRGLFRFNGTSWTTYTGWDPSIVVGWGGGLAVDFGAARGLFLFSGTAWSHLSMLSAQAVASAYPAPSQ